MNNNHCSQFWVLYKPTTSRFLPTHYSHVLWTANTKLNFFNFYLRPATNNVQGGHEVYNLATKRVITRRKLTPLPVGAAVIKAVEAIARSEGQTGLKLTSTGDHLIYDSALTAGVVEDDDYKNTYDDQDNDYENTYIDDQNERKHNDDYENTNNETIIAESVAEHDDNYDPTM
jgi:hypothetical protein